MDVVAEEYLGRIRDAIEQQSALGRLSHWIERHTTLNGSPFSFKDHEFQRAIIDDKHHDVCVIKPSQVGMSEVMSRLTLSFLAVTPSAVAIMTLPTVWEAQRFAKSRLDPVIDGAKRLKQMMSAGSDGSTFKQIGTSQLHMAGTHGKAIISIPTDILVCDEIDFSDQEKLITAESRLTHSRFLNEQTGLRGIKRRFSTPTIPKYGVSGLFEQSDQHYRLLKCGACGHWFWPNWLLHCVVEGFDRPFEEMTHYDVEDLEVRGLVDTARLLCEKCHQPVDLGPENREWVAAHPDREARGYSVSPFDLPNYHTPPAIMRKLKQYKDRTGHFRNFTLGLSYADSSNSILADRVTENTVLQGVPPDMSAPVGVSGCVAGLDVGKTSWFLVGKPTGYGRIDVLYAEAISLRGSDDETLETRVSALLSAYRVALMVCDAQPYTDTMLRIQKAFPEQTVLLNTYTLRDSKVASYLINEKDWTVSSNRTKTLDVLVKKVNSGKFRFPKIGEMAVVAKHLQGTKRIDRVLDDGDVESEYQKVGEDHYAHSLNYLNLAAEILEDGSVISGFSALPTLTFAQAHVGRVYENTNTPISSRRTFGLV